MKASQTEFNLFAFTLFFMSVGGTSPWSMRPLTFPKCCSPIWYSLESVKHSLFFCFFPPELQILVDLKAFENNVASPFNAVVVLKHSRWIVIAK